MASERLTYFAYGSNLHRADLRARCADAQAMGPARLLGWRLTFRGVADIEPAEGRFVHGALWSVSAEDVRCLDRYEGAPSLYSRRSVEVETPLGPRTAMTYVMQPGSYLGLPSPWYFERIETGYRDWDLPVGELHGALEEVRTRLSDMGVRIFRPDGRKRLRAVLED